MPEYYTTHAIYMSRIFFKKIEIFFRRRKAPKSNCVKAFRPSPIGGVTPAVRYIFKMYI